jgi:hypothetical protein
MYQEFFLSDASFLLLFLTILVVRHRLAKHDGLGFMVDSMSAGAQMLNAYVFMQIIARVSRRLIIQLMHLASAATSG